MSKADLRDREFLMQAIADFFKNNPQYYTPQEKEKLEREFLKLIEQYKSIFENFVNILLTTNDAANAVAFVWLSKKLGFSTGGIATIFNHITGLKENARFFINSVGANSLGIQNAAKKIGTASTVLLIFTVAIQVLIHIKRNEHGLAIGEIIKTVFSVMCMPVAIIDMLDQLLSTVAPGFMSNPFVRVIRMWNPAQAGKHLANTFYTLGTIWAYAYYNQYGEIERALNKLATHWEQSPMSIATEASRSVVEILDRHLPNWARFSWIVNLAQYHRNHPLSW